MNVINDTIAGFSNMPIPYTLLRNENAANKLAVIFPGIRYTGQSPLFHYSYDFLIDNAYDIITLHYQYQQADYAFYTAEEKSDILKRDVKTVLDAVLKDTVYDSFLLIGKSLGTIAISSELNRAAFKDAKIVWLTPLLESEDIFETMLASSNNSLCFIGDKDPHYIEERYNRLKEKHSLAIHLIPNADHSLEYQGDPIGSLDVLKDVLRTIKNFQE